MPPILTYSSLIFIYLKIFFISFVIYVLTYGLFKTVLFNFLGHPYLGLPRYLVVIYF